MLGGAALGRLFDCSSRPTRLKDKDPKGDVETHRELAGEKVGSAILGRHVDDRVAKGVKAHSPGMSGKGDFGETDVIGFDEFGHVDVVGKGFPGGSNRGREGHGDTLPRGRPGTAYALASVTRDHSPTHRRLVTRAVAVFAVFAAVVVVVLAGVAVPASAQTEPATRESIRVAVKPIEPFVIYGDDAQVSGFSIDLWNEIARRIGVDTSFVRKNTVADVVEAVESSEVDVAIAAISITPERESIIDFTHSYYDGGLAVLVRKTTDGSPFTVVARSLQDARLIQPFLVLLLFAVVIAHLMWFVEHKNNPDFPSTYGRGMVESMWWSLVNVFTGGDAEKRVSRPISRLIAIVWMVVGVILIAFLTASVTAALTVSELRTDITGIKDLPGRRVVSVRDTNPAKYLDRIGLSYQSVSAVDVAVKRLTDGEVDAVVFDEPVLRYAASRTNALELVGGTIQPDKYGIALPQASPRREAINNALLQLAADGTLASLNQRWFGDR